MRPPPFLKKKSKKISVFSDKEILDSARPPRPPFGVFPKKTSFFFLMPPLTLCIHVRLWKCANCESCWMLSFHFLGPRGPLIVPSIPVRPPVHPPARKKNPDHLYSLINHRRTTVKPHKFWKPMTHAIHKPPAMTMIMTMTNTYTKTKTKTDKFQENGLTDTGLNTLC